MASLFIKDSETAALAADLAEMLGTTKTKAVRDTLRRRKKELARRAPKKDVKAKLEAWYKAHPLPAPTGLKADKNFFDWLSGEEGVDDPFR